MAKESAIERTLIVEGDAERAKQFAKSLRGNEADTRCTFASTNQGGLNALLEDTTIRDVCFHGQMLNRNEGRQVLRRFATEQRIQAAHG